MIRPGEVFMIKGNPYKVVAVNNSGKVIASPVFMKEGIEDMALRLQSAPSEIPKLDPAAQ